MRNIRKSMLNMQKRNKSMRVNSGRLNVNQVNQVDQQKRKKNQKESQKNEKFDLNALKVQ